MHPEPNDASRRRPRTGLRARSDLNVDSSCTGWDYFPSVATPVARAQVGGRANRCGRVSRVQLRSGWRAPPGATPASHLPARVCRLPDCRRPTHRLSVWAGACARDAMMPCVSLPLPPAATVAPLASVWGGGCCCCLLLPSPWRGRAAGAYMRPPLQLRHTACLCLSRLLWGAPAEAARPAAAASRRPRSWAGHCRLGVCSVQFFSHTLPARPAYSCCRSIPMDTAPLSSYFLDVTHPAASRTRPPTMLAQPHPAARATWAHWRRQPTPPAAPHLSLVPATALAGLHVVSSSCLLYLYLSDFRRAGPPAS